jgi:hypothetical protein
MQKIIEHSLILFLMSFMLSGCYYDAPAQRTDLQPDFYPQEGDVNTSTYPDAVSGQDKVVYDLNGYWKVWLGYADAVAIVQVDDRFAGRTVAGGGCCSHAYAADRLLIRGRVDGNLIHCEKRTAGNEWESSVTAFSEDASEFYCLGFPVRRFERLGPTEPYH